MDEAVLALLHLNIREEDKWGAWAWKDMPWEATDRLHEKGLVGDPKKSPAKPVVLTEEGRRAAEEAFRRLFAS